MHRLLKQVEEACFRKNELTFNIGDTVDGLVKGKRYLIRDRDPLFTAAISQSKRVRGAIRSDDKGVLPRQNHLLR